MSTFLNSFLTDFQDRQSEINLLIEKARDIKDSDSPYYDALCRSAVLLMSAHLEGFIKDLVKNIINDLNQFSEFRKIPFSIQKTYCLKYLGNDNEDKKIKQIEKLVAKFSEVNAKITDEPFFFDSRNPNAHIIRTTCQKFGIKNVFHFLTDSDIDTYFRDAPMSELEELKSNLHSYLLERSQQYPYTFQLSQYNLIKKTVQKNQLTSWEVFIDDLVDKRNRIAHGTSFVNLSSIGELEKYQIAIKLLELGLISIVGIKSNPTVT